MYLTKTPTFIQKIFTGFVWHIPTAEKVIYLTFDDGPIPDVTPWVLGQLAKHNAKATFFCVGDNVHKHGEVFLEVLRAGHAVGNHTFNHLNGWSSGSGLYCENVRRCADLVHSRLFRPPYGRLRPSQSFFLKKKYRVVLWDVLSGDFDGKTSRTKCLQNVLKNTGCGSIVVFHDSWKAWEKLQFALPQTLEFFTAKGYRFEALTEEVLPTGRLLK